MHAFIDFLKLEVHNFNNCWSEITYLYCNILTHVTTIPIMLPLYLWDSVHSSNISWAIVVALINLITVYILLSPCEMALSCCYVEHIFLIHSEMLKLVLIDYGLVLWLIEILNIHFYTVFDENLSRLQRKINFSLCSAIYSIIPFFWIAAGIIAI